MLKRKHILLASAVAAVMPAVSQGVAITFSYDNVQFWKNASLTSADGSAAVVGNAVTVPQGDYFTIGLSASTPGVQNAARTGGTAGAYSAKNAAQKQPDNLGVGFFSSAMQNSNTAIIKAVGADASLNAGQNSTASSSASVWTAASAHGYIQPANGTVGENDSAVPPFSPGVNSQSNPIAGTVNAASIAVNNNTSKLLLSEGVAAPVETYTGLGYKALAAGTSLLTPLFDVNNTGFIKYVSGGTVNTDAPVYAIQSVAAGGNTIAALAPLLVTVQGTQTATPIISLTSTANAGTAVSVGTNFSGTSNPAGATSSKIVNVVGTNPGYNIGQLNNIAGPGKTGQAEIEYETSVGGPKSAPGVENIALNVLDSAAAQGTNQYNTDLAALLADINSATLGLGPGTAWARGDGTAPASAQSALAFINSQRSAAGEALYDLIIQVPSSAANGGTAGDSFLGINLPGDTALPTGLSIVDIAAVPEPASVAGLLIGASGLLMGRRKRKA